MFTDSYTRVILELLLKNYQTFLFVCLLAQDRLRYFRDCLYNCGAAAVNAMKSMAEDHYLCRYLCNPFCIYLHHLECIRGNVLNDMNVFIIAAQHD